MGRGNVEVSGGHRVNRLVGKPKRFQVKFKKRAQLTAGGATPCRGLEGEGRNRGGATPQESKKVPVPYGKVTVPWN